MMFNMSNICSYLMKFALSLRSWIYDADFGNLLTCMIWLVWNELEKLWKVVGYITSILT